MENANVNAFIMIFICIYIKSEKDNGIDLKRKKGKVIDWFRVNKRLVITEVINSGRS